MPKPNQSKVAIDAGSAGLRLQNQGRRQDLGGVGHQLDGELSNLHGLGGRERVAKLELLVDLACENDEGPPARFQHDEARSFFSLFFIGTEILRHPRVNDLEVRKEVTSRSKTARRDRRG